MIKFENEAKGLDLKNKSVHFSILDATVHRSITLFRVWSMSVAGTEASLFMPVLAHKLTTSIGEERAFQLAISPMDVFLY